MKKVIVGISAAAAVIGGFFYFAWYDPVMRSLRPRR